ncbi:MAG: glycosyltransferase family 2 protein [Vicinamibacterales bacterium]
MPRLSIVIVTYNSEADIERCLSSLRAHPPSVDFDVTVVDNSSADRTVAVVRDRFRDVHVITAPGNVGFAAANNLAIRGTASELLLLLNPDTILTAGAIDSLVATLDRRSDVAACGPRLVDLDGRAELSFGPMMSPFGELRQKVLVRGHARRWPVVTGIVERRVRRPAEPDWVSGACLCVRRADAESVGLLDERYFLYAEDVDFCAALRARGRRIFFEPAAEVVHARGQSRRSAASASERAYRASQLAFYAKHHPGWEPLLRLYLRVRGQLG